MIQTFDKVLGEANDPNTVIATGTLAAGELVVGAGNKGVKTVNLGANKLFHTNSEAKLTGLDFSTPNKYVCTDENGNLTLKDKPEITPITLTLATLSFADGEEMLTLYTPDNMTGLPDKLIDWLSGTGQTSLIEIEKPTEDIDSVLHLYLSNGLTVSTVKNFRIILTLEVEALSSGEKPILSRNISFSTVDDTVKVEILNVADTLNDCSRYYITLNKVISVPFGNYPLILVPITIPVTSADKCYLRVSGCLISEE